jgi:hypothetical protein
VLAGDMESGEDTGEGAISTQHAAIGRVERRAKAYLGGNDATWFVFVGAWRYAVWQIEDGGNRSKASVTNVAGNVEGCAEFLVVEHG